MTGHAVFVAGTAGLLALLSSDATAQADSATSLAPTAPYTLALGNEWKPLEPVPEGLLAAYRAGTRRAALVRIDYPNRDAWRKKRAFFEQVERGLAASTRGYRRLSQRTTRIARVPVLDINYRRQTEAGEEEVWARFLFFRRFSVALVLSVPSAEGRRAARGLRSVLKSFEPAPAED